MKIISETRIDGKCKIIQMVNCGGYGKKLDLLENVSFVDMF